MEATTSSNKQLGFFSLGISLIVLAIGGGTALVVSQNSNDQISDSQQQTVVSTEQSEHDVVSIDTDTDSE